MSRPVELLARGFGAAALRLPRPGDLGLLDLPTYASHEIASGLATKPVVKPGSRPIIGA
jgi:hypothetical protein